jgi:hypothetical protein
MVVFPMRAVLFLTVVFIPALLSLAGGAVKDFGPQIPAIRLVQLTTFGKDSSPAGPIVRTRVAAAGTDRLT